jgi:3-oxoacid CoA-transferase subunit A
MATAAVTTIAEVEQLVEPGMLDGDHVITPGIFVKRIVRGDCYKRQFERLRNREA